MQVKEDATSRMLETMSFEQLPQILSESWPLTATGWLREAGSDRSDNSKQDAMGTITPAYHLVNL